MAQDSNKKTMDNKQLYEYISAYVDGELSPPEKSDLLKIADKDKSIKRAIESEVKFKLMLRSRISSKQAPDRLRKKVGKLLLVEQQRYNRNQSSPSGVTEHPADTPAGGRNRFLFSVAALVLVGIFLVLARQYGNNDALASPVFSVEDLTYEHYVKHEGVLLSTIMDAGTTVDAQLKLKEVYGCNITVPELKGARFSGVVYADFLEGFHTPMLKYEVSEGDYIYMFAFETHLLDDQMNLQAYEKAQQSIVKHDDVYIKRVNGHDVISWKWGEVWYTAVSEHTGDVLASMLPH